MMRSKGTVYLIHFDKPLKHARHYLGWADRLDARLAHHRTGNGARLMAAVATAGIGWEVVRTWPGDRTWERRLKRGKNAPQICPVCNPGNRRRERA